MVRDKKLFREVIDFYVRFSQQLSMKAEFSFKCNDRFAVMIDNFIDMSKKGNKAIGENFLADYFEFQYNFWIDKFKTSWHSDVPALSWIIGVKAFKRWEKRSKLKFKYHIRNNLKRRTGIRSKKIKSEWREILLKVNEIEEKDKKIYYGTVKGFLFCYINTTGYFHKSTLCSMCFKREECKENLRLEHPSVFALRGYNEN